MSARQGLPRGRAGGSRWRSAVVAVALLLPACGTRTEVGPGSGAPAATGATTSTETTLPAGPVSTLVVTTASTAGPTTGSSTTVSSTTEQATTTTATTSEPSTTSEAVSTTQPSDPEVAANQERLTALGYWLGEVDGRFGPMTAHAVTAFQKAEGLPRTGELDAATVERLVVASTPTAQSTTGTVLEIDRTRQILLVVDNGVVGRIYDIASGAAATPTPTGRFTIYHQVDGYRHAPLGTLYRPKYFNGGIALHGYTSVPSQPASHGCVRMTYPAMDALWASGKAPVGTPVWVYDS